MEDATKALLIAAGVLIGVMILSLGATLFSELSAYVESSHDTIRFNELNAFNTQFLKYDGSNNLTIHDVITAANIASENNTTYNLTESSRGNESIFYVAVDLIDGGVTKLEVEINKSHTETDKTAADLLGKYVGAEFQCSCEISENTGRVYKVEFRKNP